MIIIGKYIVNTQYILIVIFLICRKKFITKQDKIFWQIRGEEVEERVERRLQETEWKLLVLAEASRIEDY